MSWRHVFVKNSGEWLNNLETKEGSGYREQ